MAQRKGPIQGVFESHGRYYRLMRQDGRKVWMPLSRVSDGLSALYQALADLHAPPPADGIRALIESWEGAELPRLAGKTQADARRINAAIGAAFAEFRAGDVGTPDVVQYLADYRDRPRTHNAHRAQVRELMRYAELLGWRAPGSNPTAAIRTMSTPARTRYITDSELRRIKVAAMRGRDGLMTDSGPMLCGVIDLLYLTAQPIGDVLGMDASDANGPVLRFQRSKVAGSTGASVRIGITPKLRAVLDRLLAIRRHVASDVMARRNRPTISAGLVVTTHGERARYDGIKSAWARACDRAGVADAHIHDIRAKALTDIERTRGMRAARVAGQHATEAQTADYVRAREAEIVEATR